MTTPDARRAMPMLLLGLLLGAGGQALAEPRRLGEVSFRCEARQVRIKGSPDGNIPPGKYEWVKVAVPRDIVEYDCGARRRSLFCRLDTAFVRVRRSTVPNVYSMECWGDPPLLAPIEGEGDAPAEGTPGETPAGAAGTAGATPGTVTPAP